MLPEGWATERELETHWPEIHRLSFSLAFFDSSRYIRSMLSPHYSSSPSPCRVIDAVAQSHLQDQPHRDNVPRSFHNFSFYCFPVSKGLSSSRYPRQKTGQTATPWTWLRPISVHPTRSQSHVDINGLKNSIRAITCNSLYRFFIAISRTFNQLNH